MAIGTRPQIRVVLADDHPSLRAPLATYLELSGDITVVGEASDGREAIALAEQHQPGVILLDLNMPNMSGLDALPEIKKVSPNVRVLVLTGRDETPYIMRALRGGANGYAEQVQRLHCDPEALAGRTERLGADLVEAESGERVRGDDVDPAGHRQAGIVAADDER